MSEAAAFSNFFVRAARVPQPHAWQLQLGGDDLVRDRLIRIPTGFGKTAGVVLTWLYHRVERGDLRWPTRLVFTLPMRVLVEQTLAEVRAWAERAGVDVGVFPLMGGLVEKEYAADPARPAVLVGTQDMLLSRALMRGYAAARGRWPIDFGLLHQDALWILDEVQLMDVGLATTAQLAAFRSAEGARALRPTFTWWMSATLQPRWLGTIDLRARVPALAEAQLRIPQDARRGGLWEVTKSLVRSPAQDPKEVAALVAREHRPGRLTLIVMNRVDRAVEIEKALARTGCPAERRLVHSRFRPHERERWAATFLRRDSELPEAGRILVATQVVEAGVDLSAELLVTDLAPWPSLVQRFGRAARYEGETGRVVVVGEAPAQDKDALPYSAAELSAAAEALAGLADVSPASLEAFEEALPALQVVRLYPYAPPHVLRRPDLDELFDTTADLTGADLDVSRFVRSGEERDVSVFWREVEGDPREISLDEEPLPRQEELCPVPVGRARKWLEGRPAWRLSYVEGRWERQDPQRLAPGTVLLVASTTGGYHLDRGWDPTAKGAVAPVPARPGVAAAETALERSSATVADEDLSAFEWKTIATHGQETGEEAARIATAVGLPASTVALLSLAGRWHDLGKAHRAFQDAIATEARQVRFGPTPRTDLAKAPDAAWVPPRDRRPRGFRHELASALALLDALARARPEHDALTGPWREFLEPAEPAPNDLRDHPLAAEVAELDGPSFDLLLWLVMTHHGKIRCSLPTTPADDERRISGVADGDAVPSTTLVGAHGNASELPSLDLRLAIAELGVHPRYGASWSDRVARLVRRHGPFALAYLEALLRAADVRASCLTTEDPRL